VIAAGIAAVNTVLGAVKPDKEHPEDQFPKGTSS
jgi:hypothetical protein